MLQPSGQCLDRDVDEPEQDRRAADADHEAEGPHEQLAVEEPARVVGEGEEQVEHQPQRQRDADDADEQLDRLQAGVVGHRRLRRDVVDPGVVTGNVLPDGRGRVGGGHGLTRPRTRRRPASGPPATPATSPR
ncbi:hypothetical protein [Ornithinimicrobium kibberense]|uniref:hypothetical protein n=1 Tax=Ornithinimicrobium kibberense TaxID=282060 RepID=UPI003609C200